MVGSNTRARDHLINRIEQKGSPKISYVISKLVDRTENVFMTGFCTILNAVSKKPISL